MKRILIILLTVFLVIGLVACDKSAEEKAAEKMIEDMTDGKIDVDINDGGNSISISSEEGDIEIKGDEDGMPWPTDELPSNVPVLNGAKVVGKVNVGNGVVVTFEGCDKNMGENYVKDMVTAGWEIIMEMETDGVYMTMAQNGDETISFTWSEDDDGAGTMTYGKAE